MDDKNAFEHQLAAEICYEVGPPHAVDALAITRAAKTTTPRWRIQSMFSPVKAITAALIFTVGGAMLIAQPLGQQGNSVPGAETGVGLGQPVEFTGRSVAGACVDDTVEVVGDVTYSSGGSCHPTFVMSDPRLSGKGTWSQSYGEYDERDIRFGYEAITIENDSGIWRQRPVARAFFPDSSDDPIIISILDGEGDYDGLVAVLEGSGRGGAVRGVIIDAPFPSPPEDASTE